MFLFLRQLSLTAAFKGQLPFWRDALLRYFCRGDRYYSLIVLLPHLEHSFRRVYVAANDAASRLLTAGMYSESCSLSLLLCFRALICSLTLSLLAENGSLYTTLDVLLALPEADAPNRIFEEIPAPLMHAIFDCFVRS